MRVAAETKQAPLLLIELDDGTAAVLDTDLFVYTTAASIESVMAHGGGWRPYTGDADPAVLLARATPDYQVA